MTYSRENKQRQEDEVVAISSMYPDEFEDLRKGDAWKVWRPPHISVCLSSATEANTKNVRTVTIIFEMCNKYPDVVPKISFCKENGLSKSDLMTIEKNVLSRANEIVGQEMIMELISVISGYLASLNQPMFHSLHEETTYHAKCVEARAAEQLRKQREDQNADRERRRLEVLQAQDQRKRELRKQRRANKISTSSNKTEVCSRGENFFPTDRVRSAQAEPITVKFDYRGQQSVLCGSVTRSFDRDCAIFHGVDSKSGKSFVLKQFIFNIDIVLSKKHRKDNDRVRKLKNSFGEQCHSVDRELNTIAKVEHENIIKCVNMTVVDDDHDAVSVYLLEEYTGGFDTCSFLKSGSSMPLSQLHHVSTELCRALSVLHARDIVHRDLRCSSVVLCPDHRVRLADCTLGWRLSELGRRTDGLRSVYDGECYPTTAGRSGKRADIHRLGIVLLSLARGLLVHEANPSVPCTLPTAFADFLRRCLARDEHARWTAGQLLEHEFLKQPPDVALRCLECSRSEQSVRQQHRLSPPSSSTVFEVGCSERLQNEFDILEQAGKGGYGSVIKVRHKLDGQLYAIKQVTLDPNQPKECQKIIKEAIVLSRLQHDNVVRYFSAWKGMKTLSSDTESSEQTATDTKTGSVVRPTSVSVDFQASANITSLSSRWNTSRECDLVETDSSSDSGAWCPAAAHPAAPDRDSSCDSVVFDGGSVLAENGTHHETNEFSPQKQQHQQKQPASLSVQYLFIQMEFCERKTLRTAINAGLHSDQQSIWRLYREILEGLYYVHRQGLIHRDLKPDNVFIQDTGSGTGHDYRAKLGDFGLAVSKGRRVGADSHSLSIVSDAAVARLDRSHQHPLPEAFEFSAAGVGTTHYRAPELSVTSGGRQYTNKVDIYSLGVIFFEMCHCAFSTVSERYRVLDQLRQPEVQLPEDVGRWMSDQQVQLVCWMLRHDALVRPSAAELLASDLVPAHSREEALFGERLNQALRRPASARFKRLMDTVFAPRTARAEDELYDAAVLRTLPTQHSAVLATSVRGLLARVFEQFGAVSLTLPLLAPVTATTNTGQLRLHETLLNSDGALLKLPRALRWSVARLVGRTAPPLPCRRYSIGTVYTQHRPHGVHPRQHMEAVYTLVQPAVASLPSSPLQQSQHDPRLMNHNNGGNCDEDDSVATLSGAIADAELLSVAVSVLAAVSGRTDIGGASASDKCAGGFVLLISHMRLLEAAFTAANLPAGQWAALVSDLSQCQRSLVADKVVSLLSAYSLSERMRGWLATVLCTRCELSAVHALFRGRPLAAPLSRSAVHELERIISLAREMMLITVPVTVLVGLVLSSDHWLYNGMVIQLARPRDGQFGGPVGAPEVLVHGGRCDRMLAQFWHLRPRQAPVTPPHFGCVTVSFDRCVGLLSSPHASPLSPPAPCQVVVLANCADSTCTRRQLSVVRALREAGLATCVFSGESVEEAARADEALQWASTHAARALILPKPADPLRVLVRCMGAVSGSERLVAVSDLLGHLTSMGVIGGADGSGDHVTNEAAATSAPSSSSAVSTTGDITVHWAVTLSRHKAATCRPRGSNFIDRAHFERKVGARIRSELAALGGQQPCLHVLATELSGVQLEPLTGLCVNAESPAEFQHSVTAVLQRYEQRAHRSVSQLCALIERLRVQRCVLVLYGVMDEARRILLCSGRVAANK